MNAEQVKAAARAALADLDMLQIEGLVNVERVRDVATRLASERPGDLPDEQTVIDLGSRLRLALTSGAGPATRTLVASLEHALVWRS